jgi:tetratricopeptide (TPR) repeat protein
MRQVSKTLLLKSLLIVLGFTLPHLCLAYDLRDNAIEHARQGQLHMVLGHPAVAIEEFKAALRLNGYTPLAAGIYNNLGIAYQSTRQYALAIAALQRACRLHPGYALYYRNLTEAYWRAGTLPKVQNRLLEEIRNNPDHGEAWYLLGFIYQKQGETVEARRCLEKYHQLEPQNEMTYVTKKSF